MAVILDSPGIFPAWEEAGCHSPKAARPTVSVHSLTLTAQSDPNCCGEGHNFSLYLRKEIINDYWLEANHLGAVCSVVEIFFKDFTSIYGAPPTCQMLARPFNIFVI